MLRPWKYNIHRILIGISFTFWLLNQWRFNQVQKLVVHRCILSFSLVLCGLILIIDFKHNFHLKNVKKFHSNHPWDVKNDKITTRALFYRIIVSTLGVPYQKEIIMIYVSLSSPGHPLQWGSVTHQMPVPVPSISCCVS